LCWFFQFLPGFKIRFAKVAALYSRWCLSRKYGQGLEISTGMRLSQVVEEVLGSSCRDRFAVLSGPSHAEEVSLRLPTAVTVAAYDQDTAFYIQDIFMDNYFRVYTNPDIAGVELGGALKKLSHWPQV
jgi:glycerol-3-phosphate dehydrogenase (NAD(P)+)